eukprot:1327904-Pleurochrysis_carterae.AAC.2
MLNAFNESEEDNGHKWFEFSNTFSLGKLCSEAVTDGGMLRLKTHNNTRSRLACGLAPPAKISQNG